jgi:phosphoserine phosphatase
MTASTHVATAICNPQTPILDEEVLTRAAKALPNAQKPVWLDPGIAADIAYTPTHGHSIHAQIAPLMQALSGKPIDVIAQPIATRRKSLLLADMDSTMIGQECIDELADFAGLKPQVAAITERAMRGELPFEPALRERVALLKGVSVDVVDQIIAERLTLTPGAIALVRTMRAHGGYACLVSGGFTLFTGKIGAMIGFDENRANILNHQDHLLLGTVTEPILGHQAKLDTLVELRQTRGIASEKTLAVGDGANDLAMLAEASLGIAFHAKPAVSAAADAQINHADLTALLYAQGYTSRDFITS